MMEQPRGQVLIIDDDMLIRELLELLLSRNGYEVHKASSGEAALAMLAARELQPSTILADLQLPGIAGNALAHRLRTLVDGETRILAMSGSQPGEEEMEGFDGFARKPLNEDTLNNLFQSDSPSSGLQDGDSPAVAPLNSTVYARLASS
ncbi:MAG TPA: response regulator, partial [Edaphobacter sp.]|nr:response regulator [Edaphobacter sp.]